jgi:hypothetical protein
MSEAVSPPQMEGLKEEKDAQREESGLEAQKEVGKTEASPWAPTGRQEKGEEVLHECVKKQS